jgi:hypothetical protein
MKPQRKDTQRKQTIVLAAGAHPDDIEFTMAGTLLRLKEAGAKSVERPRGSMGTGSSARKAARVRTAESKAATAGAEFPALDLEGYYEARLARVAAVVRRIQPNLVSLQSPCGFHGGSSERGAPAGDGALHGDENMRPFPCAPYAADCAIYRPAHGLRDGLGSACARNIMRMSAAAPRKKHARCRSVPPARRVAGMHQYSTPWSRSREVGRMSGKFTPRMAEKIPLGIRPGASILA